jgi:twitching motility protein PilT
MQVGQAKFGMQTFNQALAQLLMRRLITQDEAFGRSSDADELRNLLASGGTPGQRPAGPPGR